MLPWQWAKISLATVRLAAALYRRPELLLEPVYDTVKGPEFELTGRKGSTSQIPGRVRAGIADSGLVVTGARAV